MFNKLSSQALLTDTVEIYKWKWFIFDLLVTGKSYCSGMKSVFGRNFDFFYTKWNLFFMPNHI